MGHRMALHYPDRVTRLAVLDIVPTHYLYTHVTLPFVQAYYHWFSYLRPSPTPENELKENIERQASKMSSRCRARIPPRSARPGQHSRHVRGLSGWLPQSDPRARPRRSRQEACVPAARTLGRESANGSAATTCWASGASVRPTSPADRFPPAITCKRTRLSWSPQNCGRSCAERSHPWRRSSADDSPGRGLASAPVGLTSFVGLAASPLVGVARLRLAPKGSAIRPRFSPTNLCE